MSVVRRVPFEDFDPNNLSNAYTLWACWTGTQFKTFATRAAALNCFSSWGRVKLYEYVPLDGWVERAVKDPSNVTDVCDNCNVPGVRNTWAQSFSSLSAAFQWERRGGKITTPLKLLHVCRPCCSIVSNR